MENCNYKGNQTRKRKKGGNKKKPDWYEILKKAVELITKVLVLINQIQNFD